MIYLTAAQYQFALDDLMAAFQVLRFLPDREGFMAEDVFHDSVMETLTALGITDNDMADGDGNVPPEYEEFEID